MSYTQGFVPEICDFRRIVIDTYDIVLIIDVAHLRTVFKCSM